MPHDDHLVYMGLEAEEAEGEMGEGRLEKPMAQPAEVQIIIIVIIIVIASWQYWYMIHDHQNGYIIDRGI